MKKINDIIDKAYNFGKLPIGFSMFDFRELERINSYLDDKDKTTTINQNVANKILKLYPKKVISDGIGWLIG